MACNVKKNQENVSGQEKRILVTVAVYAYNEEKFIHQALDSIVRQKTNFKFEVVVHDDASTDSTAKIIKEYERCYPELIKGIYQSENQYQKGVYIPLKCVYPVVRGKYMAYCDGDDYWTDEYKLQKQVDFLESHPDYVLCTHAFKFLDEGTKKVFDNHTYGYSRDMSPEDFIKWDGSKMPQIGTWLYRTDLSINRPSLFQRISVDKVMTISDQPLGMYLTLQGKIWYMDDIMSVWRRYSSSVSGKMLTDNIMAFTESKIRFLRASKRKFGAEYNRAFMEEIEKQQLLLCFYKGEYRRIPKFNVFKALPFSMKIRIYFGCLSPKIYNLLREVKQKIEWKRSWK